jgi:hypothetical protein
MPSDSLLTRQRVDRIWLGVIATTAALATITAAATEAQTADSACHVLLRGADFVGLPVDLARLLDLTDSASHESFMLRRIGRHYRSAACRAPAAVHALASRLGAPPRHARARLLPVDLLAVGNSAYARDWNDGALWSGRGLNASVTAGVEFHWGPLRAALAPVLTWQQNSEYEIQAPDDRAPSPFAHPLFSYMIDAPQRFGTESFAQAGIGQSFARVELAGFTVGISNQNLTWGPARRNPLLLSGTGPGFPHVFLETARAVDVWVGGLELQLFWGRLEESDYFDADPDNDHRALAGALLMLQPYVLEGLYIGGGRLHAQTWWPDTRIEDVLLAPYRRIRQNVFGRAGDNQLISLFFRWATAPQGLEVYGEWAREDHWGSDWPWTELLRNLDASQAYSLGLQKVVRRGDRALRIAAEISHLADALPILTTRGFVPYYTNTAVTQGHTHRGQLLGAPIGTGAESQFVGADYFWREGRTSVSLERTRYEDDAYNAFFAPTFGAHARDTELSLRAGHVRAFGAVTVDAEFGWSLRYNRSFLGLDTLAAGGRYRRDDNWSARVGARWAPREVLP